MSAQPTESTPTATATTIPAPTPVAVSLTEQVITPSPSPAPSVALQPVGSKAQLSGISHQWQTWNNCGPATITMNMSYFGRPELQADAAPFLKPNRDDKNVSPEELAAYARTTGMEALVRRGGSIEQLKLLLSHNLPVLAETWLVHDEDGLGHYRLVTGFDDATRQFNTFDSLNGPDFQVSYEQFDSDWRVFNRVYVLVYPPEQADTIAAIIGPDMDDTMLDERLVAEAEAEVEAKPEDAIAYFNLGDSLTRLGRFQEAVAAFDRARQLGLHWRRLWYQFTPFEAYYAAGRYQDVLDLTEATIKGSGGLEEAYYYKGLALQALGQPGAEVEFQAALDYNPNFAAAAEAMQN
ncbi:MAG: tetratricopeptide repeat protein [Anaerolineales bacterium]|nr:tetratricopeptide repeat protein [Anaerolineales bacterium]